MCLWILAVRSHRNLWHSQVLHGKVSTVSLKLTGVANKERKCTGVIWLLTFGVLTLGQIYDLFMMSSVMEDAQAQKEANVWDKRKLGHSKNAKIKAGGRQKWINENQ